MKLRSRLQRLEQQATRRQEETVPAPVGDSAAYLAYLQGTGPRPADPPCPKGFNPAAWESRMRLIRTIDARLTGELAAGTYPPELDAAERWNLDGSVQVMRLIREGYPENQQNGSVNG